MHHFLPTEKSCLINIPKCCFHGLAGILQTLDHFQYLNIKSVWIGPVYRSPMKDFGYDVEDFRSISPEFGTMQDFDELLVEMHNRGRGFYGSYQADPVTGVATGFLYFCFHQV